jgi:hypothetical protein
MAKRRVHRVPHEEVRAVLLKHGITTVSRAIEWGDTVGSDHEILDAEGEPTGQVVLGSALISGKTIEGILRGKRKLGVEFERVDAILCALGAPHHWYMELQEWYYPRDLRPDPEGETFLSQRAAFERACEMFEGMDAALLFG